MNASARRACHGRKNGNGAARDRRRTVRDRRPGIAGGDVVAHLAYNGEDGTPRVIPVGFFWTGTEFVISTATTSPKVTALKEPLVATIVRP
jgi:nitroimidazol reductase NimA-like FMN-containing flavoprotein (pyridoxamine 5'-phosphate oxidase superfamily)